VAAHPENQSRGRVASLHMHPPVAGEPMLPADSIAVETDAGIRKTKPALRVVLLEQDPDLTGHATLMDWALAGEHAPQEHEVEAIAGQLGIDI
jgi:hypothetical protein